MFSKLCETHHFLHLDSEIHVLAVRGYISMILANRHGSVDEVPGDPLGHAHALTVGQRLETQPAEQYL